MGYVYFHKHSNDFQCASETQLDHDWLIEYEVDGANKMQIYGLEDGEPVLVGTVTELSAEEIAEGELDQLRWVRNGLLKETDWWASSDRTMTQAQIDYRQALRDITDNYTSTNDVVWPTKP